MTVNLREELDAAATGVSPRSDLVTLSRRAGQRQLARRRRRGIASLGIAVAAVAVVSGTLPHSWVQDQRTPAAGDASSPVPGPSTTVIPAVAVTGTAADWLIALQRSMPYSDRAKPVSAATNGPAQLSEATSVHAVFDYSSEGRLTTLTVTAFAEDATAGPGQSALDAALASCEPTYASCDPVQQTASGPVLVRHAAERGFVDALSFRASGVVVVARTPEVTADAASAGPGARTTISVGELVTIAALSPEPALAASAAKPAPGTPAPTAEANGRSVSPVVTVTSGQKVDLGSGSYLTVTKAEKCMVLADGSAGGASNCKSLTDGNQAQRSISLQSGSGPGGSPEIITGIYTGTDATTITVTVDGTSRTATIVKLGSHPRSLVYYLTLPMAPVASGVAGGGVSVEAFDARGRSLAKL